MGKNILQFASLFVITFILTLAVPASNYAQDKKSSDEIKLLIGRIESLEKQVKEQDTKIAELSNELNKVQNPILAIPKMRSLNDLPKGSQPFEFNGQTYYMVPIKNTVEVK